LHRGFEDFSFDFFFVLFQVFTVMPTISVVRFFCLTNDKTLQVDISSLIFKMASDWEQHFLLAQTTLVPPYPFTWKMKQIQSPNHKYIFEIPYSKSRNKVIWNDTKESESKQDYSWQSVSQSLSQSVSQTALVSSPSNGLWT
jgi:hypothetical protein